MEEPYAAPRDRGNSFSATYPDGYRGTFSQVKTAYG
jgi:hypothetical protein